MPQPGRLPSHLSQGPLRLLLEQHTGFRLLYQKRDITEASAAWRGRAGVASRSAWASLLQRVKKGDVVSAG